MASQPPLPSSPAGVPSGGSAKYVVIAVALLGLIGAAIALKKCQEPQSQPIVVVDAAPPPPAPTGRDLDDEIPPPPPVEDAGAEEAPKPAATAAAPNPCDVKSCNGTTVPALESALQFRVRQAQRCYSKALEQDSTLQGKMTVAVRVGANGQACSASIVSSELDSAQVKACVSSAFRGASFPAPKGGCVDVNIPVNFVQR